MQQPIISSHDLIAYLQAGGFIEKQSQSAGGFYCTSKSCMKLLSQSFNSFGLPSTRFKLRALLRRYPAPPKPGEPWEPAQSVIQRCFVCAYRGFRVLYKRAFGKYPDEDVPDDFNTNSDAPEIPEPILVKPKSPPKPQPRAKSPPRQRSHDLVTLAMIYCGITEAYTWGHLWSKIELSRLEGYDTVFIPDPDKFREIGKMLKPGIFSTSVGEHIFFCNVGILNAAGDLFISAEGWFFDVKQDEIIDTREQVSIKILKRYKDSNKNFIVIDGLLSAKEFTDAALK